MKYDDEISIAELWQRLLIHKWTVLTFTIGAVAVSLIAAFLMTPVYRSEVLLSPVPEEENSGMLGGAFGQLSGIAVLAGLAASNTAGTKQTIAVLQSRAFTDQFISDQDLMPVLFSDAWDPETKNWRVDDPEKVPSSWDAYKLFHKKIRSVSQDRATGLVTLSIEWRDREEAARWANLMVERINERIRDDVVTEARESIDYLNKELEKTSIVELKQAIYRLVEHQVNRIMLANVRDEYAFRIIDPAAVADQDAPIRPKKLLMVAVGVLAGLFIGILVATIRSMGKPT